MATLVLKSGKTIEDVVLWERVEILRPVHTGGSAAVRSAP